MFSLPNVIGVVVTAALVAAAAPALAWAPPPDEARPAAPASSEAVRLAVYGSAGFPAPLSVGGGLTFGRAVHVGFEYGTLPVTSLGGVDVGYQSYAGDLRIFPFASGPFYFGARVGRQHVSAAFTQALGAYGSATGSVNADGWYANPRLGFVWTSSWGLSAGIDAGVRVPLSHTTAEDVPNGIAVPSAATNTAHLFVGRVIPSVTLLQLGLLF